MQINGLLGAAAPKTVKSDEGNQAAQYQENQVIEGVISKVSEKVSINFSGRELTFPRESVQDAREGETRKYKILEATGQRLVLKELEGPKSAKGGNRPILFTNIKPGQSAFADKYPMQLLEASPKEDELIRVADQMSGEDEERLSAEGVILEEYKAESLERALVRLKLSRQMQQSRVEVQSFHLKNKEETVHDTRKETASKDSLRHAITERLEAADLPVTEELVDQIAEALRQADETHALKEDSMAYLIGNKMEPTIHNLYKAIFCGAAATPALEEGIFEQLKGQAEQLLEKAGIPVDPEGLAAAKWLLDKQLPLTVENLQFKQGLEAAITDYDRDKALDAIIKAVLEKNDPKLANLIESIDFGYAKEQVKQVKQAIVNYQSISYDALHIAIQTGKWDPGLKDLKSIQLGLEQGLIPQTLSGTIVDIEEISCRRRLEEIRLKLTVEAGCAMLMKGIRLETDGLSRIVEGLLEIEDQYYRNLLAETGASATDRQINSLRDLTDGMERLKAVPSYILGVTYSARATITAGDIGETGAALQSRLQQAGEAYETLMTAPRKDMGDSIQKAFRNIDEILQELEMEMNETNRRAVRILAYNNMELSKDQIEGMKLYDAKVNEVFRGMQPAVAATMIKEGMNPLSMNIDELNQTIAQIRGQQGHSEENNYARYLLHAEKHKEFSDTERKAYIGIYRLLNQVKKSDGAAIGAAVQAGMELSLGSLLTAVRTIKKGSIDQSIDDSFGALEELHFSTESITDQIQSGFVRKDNNDSPYYEMLVDRLLQEMTPAKLDEAVKESGHDFTKLSLEQLYEQVRASEAGQEAKQLLSAERLASIREIAGNTEAERNFLKRYEQPDSISNRLAARELLQGNRFYDQLDHLNQTQEDWLPDFMQSVDQKDDLSEAYEKLDAAAQRLIDTAYLDNEVKAIDLAALKSLRNGMRLRLSLSKREFYEIPIRTGSEITNVNLTIVRNQDEGGKVSIELPFNALSHTKIDVTVRGSGVNYLATNDSIEAMELIKGLQEEFDEEIKSLGFEKAEGYFGVEANQKRRFLDFQNGNQTQLDTNLLYQVSKIFIVKIRELESKQIS